MSQVVEAGQQGATTETIAKSLSEKSDSEKVGHTFTQDTCIPDEEISPLSNADSPCTPSTLAGTFGVDGSEDGRSSQGDFLSPASASPGGARRAPARRGITEPIAEEPAEEDASVRAAPPGNFTLPSPGSALHASGECRPCAWFHKPQGCQNGAECRHCHLCPEGEIKVRKKVKADVLRAEKEPGDDKLQKTATEEALQMEPVKVVPTTGASVLDLPPPPGLPAPAPSSEPAELPSVGSAAHGKGDCKPCAWFYKGQGCSNGKDCRHCHLCPEGEIRSRRKVKVATMREQAKEEEERTPTATPGGRKDRAWQAHQQQVQEAALLAAQVQWEAQALAGAAAVWEAAQWQVAANSPLAVSAAVGQLEFFSTAAAAVGGTMPSTGSTLHHLGKCRPCAWFWKPQGCLNGQACAHCHLCPEGELKERKRIKESAMRMGALLPAQPTSPVGGESGRSSRVVQIAPILGA